MRFKTTDSLVEKQRLFFGDDDKSNDRNLITSVVEELLITELLIDGYFIQKIKDSVDSQQNVKILKDAIMNNQPLPPILIDINNEVVDGFHRLFACIELGVTIIPTIRLNYAAPHLI